MSSKHNLSEDNTKMPAINFIDLQEQQKLIKLQIEEGIKRVLDHGTYIMGPEVAELEKKLSSFCGVKHSISCSDGTDALMLGLMAIGVGPGDAVFVPSFTFASTAEVVALVGATPIFIDVLPETYNISVESLNQGIKLSTTLGLKPTCIIPVDLFGQPADYDSIKVIAREHKLWIIADGAQAFGAYYKNQRVGSIGDITTTSFFPAKPLGCYGDGGAVFTNNDEIATKLRSLKVHGKGSDKYDNVMIGINGRLDTIQAAILIEKLKIFENEITARQKIAKYYNENIVDILKKPKVIEGSTSVWAQYTVLLPENIDRSELILKCKKVGVPTSVYYIKPLHLQKAYNSYPIAEKTGLKVCEYLAKNVLSIPMHPYLSKLQQQYVVRRLNEIVLTLNK